MKKLLCLLSLPFLCGMSIFAAEVSINTVSDTLIHYADQAIATGAVSVDTLLTVMQTIHETQKADLKAALTAGDSTAAQSTLNQRSEMYPLTTHLYDLKASSGHTINNASGGSYILKKQAPLPWINISRGDEDYYAFPTYDTFLELQRNLPQTGMVYHEMSILSGSQKYLPHYYYGGPNSLQDLSRKDEGLRITELKDETSALYFFFDLPSTVVESKDFVFSLMSGGNVSGNSVYTAVSYSPDYFLTSLDQGFQFCQEVATFIGSTTPTKEYPAQECSDAADGIFYKGMHADILKYAADKYL
jgi:hypothetical protein